MANKSLPLELARRQRELLSEVLKGSSQVSVDSLLDTLAALYEECVRLDKKHPQIQAFLQRYKTTVDRVVSARVSMKDFRSVKLLGRGAFGEVALCQCKLDDQYYAIKKLQKNEMLQRQEAFFMEERELLGLAQGQWITSLEFAFQDEDYLYLVMEYLAGGNLLNLLYKQNNFDEATARFYAAEAVLGIDEIHQMGFAYRDLKPDNMLLNHDGHLKLADFGSCIKLDENGYISSKVAVGTPYYIAPEVLQAQELRSSNAKNGVESDWWSLGVVLYEMLVGDPPFFSESMIETYSMVMNHKTSLKFPDDVELSADSIDLIKKLICNKETRLNVDGIKNHPFFKDIDWDNLRSRTPPFVPELKGPDDTSNFDEDFDDEHVNTNTSSKKPLKREFNGDALAFVGYSFVRNGLRLSLAEGNVPNGTTSAVSDAELKRLQGDVERLQMKYKEEKQQVAQLEELRQTLMGEMEKKDRALQQEVDAHKVTANQRLELQKSIKIVELEVQELERKLVAEQAEEQSHNERVKELESQLIQAIKAREDLAATFAASSSKTDAFTAEITSLRRKSEETNTFVSSLQERIAELQREQASLEKSLASEKETRSVVEGQLRDTKRQLSEAASKEAKLQSIIDENDKETDELLAEISTLQDNLNQESASKSSLQQAKTDAENRRALFELEIEQLKEQIKEEERKVLMLTAQLKDAEEARTSAADPASAASNTDALSEEINKLREALSSEGEAKSALQRKLAEAEREKTSLSQQASGLESKLAEEAAATAVIRDKLAKLQKTLDASTSEAETTRKDMESRLLIVEEELQSTRRRLDEQVAQLERTELQRMDAEKARDSAEAKLASTRKKLEDELEHRQQQTSEFEDITAKLSKERQAHVLLLSDMDATTAARDSAVRELEKLKKKFEEALQGKKEREDELAGLRKSLAVSELERGQLEKKVAEESQARGELESKLEEITLDNVKLSSVRDELEDKLAQVQKYLADAEAKVTLTQETLNARQETIKELEHSSEQLKIKYERTHLSLQSAVKKIENSFSPQTELQVKKEYRKLKEEYAALQMRYEASEAERKNLLMQLNDARSSTGSFADTKDSSKPPSIHRQSSQLSTHKGDKPELQTQTSDAQIGGGTKDDNTIFGFIKRRSTRRDASGRETTGGSIRARPLSMMLMSSSPKPPLPDFQINQAGFEGFLKLPKEKGIRQGFNKKYIVARDSHLLMFDDKAKAGEGIILVDVKSPIFLVRDPPPDMVVNVNSKEVAAMFLIYFKNSHVAASDPNAANVSKPLPVLPQLDMVTILAKIKATEKEIDIEEKLLKGAMSMLALASTNQKKQAQKQIEGTQLRLQQLRQELAKYNTMKQQHETADGSSTDQVVNPLKANSPPPTSPQVTTITLASETSNGQPVETDKGKVARKIESVLKKIATEERIKSGAETLMNMASTDGKRQSAAQQLEASKAKLAQLNTELVYWKEQSQRNSIESEVAARLQRDAVEQGTSGEPVHEFNGHQFHATKFKTTAHCQACSQLMYSPNQGYECHVCHFVVHTHCYTILGPTCDDVQSLKDVKPLIFLAADEADRDRWVTNIMSLRESLLQPESGSSSPAPSTTGAPSMGEEPGRGTTQSTVSSSSSTSSSSRPVSTAV